MMWSALLAGLVSDTRSTRSARLAQEAEGKQLLNLILSL